MGSQTTQQARPRAPQVPARSESSPERARDQEVGSPAAPPMAGPLLSLEQSLRIPVHSPRPAAGGQRRALPDTLREKMEQSFQQDFSRVQLRLSDEPSRIGARALTRGEEITLAPRHYRPDSSMGQALLGHELAHVVQQRSGRVRRGGGIFDHPHLEAEADRQGLQAARGAPVSSPSAAAAPARTASGSSLAMPFQPAWEFVDMGGSRLRRYQLKDNKDGTYTHSSSGQVYTHQGQMHPTQLGTRVLSPVSPPATTAPTPTPSPGSSSHDPKNVLFRVGETGKVEYLGNSAPNRSTYAGQYLEMASDHFARFKNSGKRTESSKVMDPVTLERYAYDEPSKQFYSWDKAAANRRGKAISTTAASHGVPSANQSLLDRFGKGELVDRRRSNRTAMDLDPFDVGPYKKAVTLPTDSDASVNRTYGALSGTDAWKTGTLVNRDHVPSGESLNQRGDSGAYDQGFTITIPNPEMHIPFSPTYGSDNSPSGKGMEDEYQGSSIKRVKFDQDNPAAGAYRDMGYMLSKTENQDYSASGHTGLDLTKPENRLRQIGGYRTLLHRNTQINRHLGGQRGINTKSPAIDFKIELRKKKKGIKKVGKRDQLGSATYTKIASTTQGQLFAKLIHKNLKRTGRAKKI